MLRKIIYIALLICLATITAIGQKKAMVKFIGDDQTLKIIETFDIDKNLQQDSLGLEKFKLQLLSHLYDKGHLLATVGPIHVSDSYIMVPVDAGKQYKWAKLGKGNVPEIMLSKTGYREKFYIDKPFKYFEVARLFKKVISQSENSGYPFSAIRLDSITVDSASLGAVLHYEQGPLIRFDTIKIQGTNKVHEGWLSTYLEIRPNAPYDQSVVDRIEKRIDQLDFLKMTTPVEITFQNKQATVNLNLKYKSANRIDGIVGFLPNAQTDGGLLVTGQFDLSINNLFSRGKELDVKWQRLKPESQSLYLAYYHPNILKSPLNFSTSFDLLKEDSTFINRTGLFGFDYKISPHVISFFTRLKSSRLLDTEPTVNGDNLPDLNDFNVNYYGAGYSYSKLDRVVAKSGISFYVEAAAGTKKIRRNASLPSEVYNGVDLNTVQYQFNGNFSYYYPISKYFVLHQRISGGNIINKQLFKNDLFRLGGLNSLRGFNENFFFAEDYAMSNIEVQLHFQPDSYLFVFYDQAYLFYSLGAINFTDYPLGVGLGLNFSTNAGIVSLAYALGKDENQELDIRLSKFHFGYIAKF